MNTWDVQATEQQLSDTRAALVNAEVMAAAARPVVAAWKDTGSDSALALAATLNDLAAAHDATTPSPTRSHTVISNTELAWLRGVRLAAEVAALSAGYEQQRAALHTLRQQLDQEPGA